MVKGSYNLTFPNGKEMKHIHLVPISQVPSNQACYFVNPRFESSGKVIMHQGKKK